MWTVAAFDHSDVFNHSSRTPVSTRRAWEIVETLGFFFCKRCENIGLIGNDGSDFLRVHEL